MCKATTRWLSPTNNVAGNRRGMYNGIPNHGLIDPSGYDKAFKELDGEAEGTITVTIREPAPKQNKPGNWKDNEVAGSYNS